MSFGKAALRAENKLFWVMVSISRKDKNPPRGSGSRTTGQSSLAPDAFTTWAHLVSSFLMKASNWVVVRLGNSAPWLAHTALASSV